jgi:hypothetical protein
MSKKVQEPQVEDVVLDQELLELDSRYSEKEQEAPVSRTKRSSYVRIRHNSTENYKDPNKASELGVDLFPGGFSRDMDLAAIVRGNKNFYLTGLDVDSYKEEWEKEFLKESLDKLVFQFGKEVLDPFAQEFWKTRRLRITEDETILDLENPEDLLTYWNIKGNGYPYIANSPDMLLQQNCRFFLEEPHLQYEMLDDNGMVYDEAIGVLAELNKSGNGFSTMFHLHKNLITTNEGITFNTPKSLLYKSLKQYINGDYSKSRKKQAPKSFLEVYELYKTNQKRVVITSYINEALEYGIISTNRDGQYINNITSFNFKTTQKEKLIEQCMLPNMQEEMTAIMSDVKQKWNKY